MYSDIEGQTLAETLTGLAPTPDEFHRNVGYIVSGAINYVLDGETFEDLEACEKTFVGTKVEKRFLRHFGLPRKVRGSAHKLDTVVNGIDVDLKFTLGSNWMIPPEALGHWCLLIQTSYEARTYSVGLLKMTEDNLTKGGNRDGKRSVSKAGKSRIQWLVQGAALPEVLQ